MFRATPVKLVGQCQHVVESMITPINLLSLIYLACQLILQVILKVTFFEVTILPTLPTYHDIDGEGPGNHSDSRHFVFHHGEYGSLKMANFTLTERSQGKLNHSVILLGCF